MPLYMRIVDDVPAGFPMERPGFIPYTDPGSGEETVISATGLTEDQLFALAGYAPVDGDFTMPAYSKYAAGGTFDEETGLATPATVAIPIETLKSTAKAGIVTWATGMRAQTAGGADAYEVAGWAVKAERAMRFSLATETVTDTAVMQAEADYRGLGETAAELAAIQLAKATLLSAAVALVDGKANAVILAIDAAADPADPGTLLAQFKADVATELAALIGGA